MPRVPSWTFTSKIIFRPTHRPTLEEHPTSVLKFLIFGDLLPDMIPGLVRHGEFYQESNPSSFSTGSTQESMQRQKKPFDCPDLHDLPHLNVIVCPQTARCSMEAHAAPPVHCLSVPSSIRNLVERQPAQDLDPGWNTSCGPLGHSDMHGKLSSTTFGRAGRHTGSGRYKNRVVRKLVRHVFSSPLPLVYSFYPPWFQTTPEKSLLSQTPDRRHALRPNPPRIPGGLMINPII